MRNLGVHAGLALVGIIAGLPVAAVVQWRREPPAEVWCVMPPGVVSSESELPFRMFPWLYTAPDGNLVTSFCIGSMDVLPSEERYGLMSIPWTLCVAADRALPSGGATYEGSTTSNRCFVDDDGVRWQRLEVWGWMHDR